MAKKPRVLLITSGVKEMKETLKGVADIFPAHVKGALYLEANIEMTKSKLRCPVSPTAAQFKAMGRKPPKNLRPGTLRASGYVADPVSFGKRYWVELGYGGAAAAYAVPQHERLDYKHTTGQAKYLESVLNESRGDMKLRLAKRIDALVEATVKSKKKEPAKRTSKPKAAESNMTIDQKLDSMLGPSKK